jgi:hypothetical protein
VVLGGEHRVAGHRRPVLQDADVDEGLVEALARDADVVAHVEVAVDVLERRGHALGRERGEVDELLVGRGFAGHRTTLSP